MEKLGLNELVQILDYVPRESQPNLLLVSRLWYQALDQYLGVHAILGRGLGIEPETTPDEIPSFDSPAILKTVGVSTCEFIDFHNESKLPIELKRPELLRAVSFKNYVSSATFESILNKRVTDLKMLQLDQTALYHLEFSDIEFSVGSCEALEVVPSSDYQSIWERQINGLGDGSTTSSKCSVIHTNAGFLLTNRFPGLSRLKITLPYVRALDLNTSRALLTLLIKHSESLKLVEIIFSPAHYTPDRNNVEGYKPPPNSRFVTSTDQLDGMLQDLNLEFPIYSLPESRELWVIWMKTLRSLGSLELIGNLDLKSCEAVVSHNAPSLHHVTLKWNYTASLEQDVFTFQQPEQSENPNPLNCLMFRACNALTHLSLEGNWKNGPILKDDSTHLGLTSTASLPKSLIHITIKHLPLDNESCRHLCLDFPKLQILKLNSIAGRVGHGVQLPVLEEITKRKQLLKFKVDLGFGSEPTIPTGILKICSVTRYSNSYVRGYLHRNGEYSDEPEDGPDTDPEMKSLQELLDNMDFNIM